MNTNNYNILIRKLDEFIRKYYKNQIIRGVIYFFSIALIFYLIVIILEYFAYFNSTARTILFYAFIIINGFILLKFVIIPVLKLFKLGKIISYEESARIIGKHFDNIKDKLLNTLQLNELKNDDLARYIGIELIEASIEQKIKELRPIPFTLAINFAKNKKYLKYLVLPVIVFLCIFLVSPGVIKDSTKRLVKHNTYFEKPAPFHFIIQNKTLEVVQNEDFKLEVKLVGEAIPDEVFIETFTPHLQRKLKKINNISFYYLFKNVQEDTPFRLFADEFYSKPYTLKVLIKPIIVNFTLTLKFPAYLRKAETKLENTGDIQIPEGTKVVWKFYTKNSKKLLMNFQDTTISLPYTDKNTFTYSDVFFKSTIYSIKTTNEFVKSKDSITYAIQVIPDLYPSIEVEQYTDSSDNKLVYFTGLINDDYGFSKLTFNYKFLNNDSIGEKSNIEEIPINKNLNQDKFFHFWDMFKSGINLGDIVEYYFEIWDNDGVNGSKSTRSQTFLYKAPTLEEIKKQIAQKNEEITDKIQQALKQSQELQEELRKLNRQLLDKKNLSWEDKQKMKDILEKQHQLEENIKNIQNENSDKINKQQEYDQLSETIFEKQKQLQELFDEIMTDEMKELFDKLNDLLDKMDKNKLQEYIENMKLTNEDIEKALDRTLELFKQLEFEQKLTETIEKFDTLLKQQKQLHNKTDDKLSEITELLKEQQKISEDFKNLRDDLQDLEKNNRELEFPHPLENTDSLENDIQQNMQNSSENLMNDNKKKSSQSQKKALQGMEQLSGILKNLQMQIQQQAQMEDINTLREILENLVKLSFDQEELMKQLSATNVNDPKFVQIAQKQKNLKDDAKMIEDSLFALSKRVIQIKPIVNREMSAINMNMAQALNYLQDRGMAGGRNIPESKKRQQQSMTAINNLALLLNEIVEQMQKQMAMQLATGSCSKPSSCSKPGMCQSISSMRQLQEMLNKQIQKLKEQMDNNPQQGKKSSRGLYSKELAQLSAEQEAIRNQLNKLKQGMTTKDKTLNDNLNKIAEKMEETERDLVNRMITSETLKRQKEITIRLLEAEKSIREQEFSEERESKEAKDIYHTPDTQKFFEQQKAKQRENELLKTIPLSLKQYYKNKVNEYFNNLRE